MTLCGRTCFIKVSLWSLSGSQSHKQQEFELGDFFFFHRTELNFKQELNIYTLIVDCKRIIFFLFQNNFFVSTFIFIYYYLFTLTFYEKF